MMERVHDQDAQQCRVEVKELRNAYRKACEANSCSDAAPATCRFYKELDAILGGDPTSTPSTTLDTSEPSSTRQEEEEEEQSRSEGAEAEEDTPESLDACSQELFPSQLERSQSWRPGVGGGQTPEAGPRKGGLCIIETVKVQSFSVASDLRIKTTTPGNQIKITSSCKDIKDCSHLVTYLKHCGAPEFRHLTFGTSRQDPEGSHLRVPLLQLPDPMSPWITCEDKCILTSFLPVKKT
ncbi:hypothetical protein UY3_16140 [Chelonia mydas]|uniref:Uncharacterized protein n=1 Tax=Chelonia mydas TaxID=8469 RepID=M7AUT3_CHEMY|nr:hypothetical protein UY3_16140 [Chelonia mydas]